MLRHVLSACWFVALVFMNFDISLGAALANEPPVDAAKVEFFEKKIRPVLVEHCYGCHSAEAQKVEGEFLLDSSDALRAGGATGQAISLDAPEKSLIVRALRHQDVEMPPDRRLPEQVAKDFEQWIREGAIDPRNETKAIVPKAQTVDWSTARQFWSFIPPRAQALPALTKTTDWPSRRVDYFVLHEMESQGLAPNPPADRQTLIRRLAIDLTDLPPSPELVQSFLQDLTPEAWERAVENLLASATFGERWSRLWLDLARYAEDQAHIVGNDRSLCYPNAFQYREWVIDAFNEDLAYDDFIRQQIAADLVEGPVFRDVRPLGFLGVGPKYYNRGSPDVMADEWEDRVDVVTRGLLGLTVACARCHDHKYDPVPTHDYYALAGVFASTSMYNHPLEQDVERKDNGEAKKPEESIHIVRDGKPTDLQVMIRGDSKRKGERAPRGFLRALSDDTASGWDLKDTSGRKELADSIASRANPLTARVYVNRIWGALIGRPLVTTPSNFGKLGSAPSHPALLDDLAFRFMESGWSTKWLIREIVTSSVYQQSSSASSESQTKDPDNVWLARMHRKRLSIEAWRDSILMSAGRLERSIGGPSINPQNPLSGRRTLYSEVSRLELNKMLALFDFPDPNVHAERRATTTTALQKLFVLNSPFMLEQSQLLATTTACEEPEEVDSTSNTSPKSVTQDEASLESRKHQQVNQRIHTLWTRVFVREPSAEELQTLSEYVLMREKESGKQLSESAWQEIAHVLLASNELMFVD